MERLTERHSGVAVIRDKNRHREDMEVLAKYEETGLTTEQVQQLKERDTAKKPIKTKGLKDFNGNVYKVIGECPNCGCVVSSMMKFCDECGQRLDWSE